MLQSTLAPPVVPLPPDQPVIDATVLICTFNRAADLARTLDSLARTTCRLRWEVLVVDNNSSDDTRHVVESRSGTYPAPLRYLFEGRQGKSNALNSGMNAACAGIILFTDDDVVVGPEWLDAAVRPLIERREIDYTGGPVRPIWPGAAPSWLSVSGNLGAPLAVTDHGPEPFVFEEQRKTPLGVNMAVRRRLIERIGGFRPDLGRNGKSLLGQEQAEFFYRARGAGARGLYVPAMGLAHVVPASRLTRSYFRRWWYWKGVSHARVHRIHGRTEIGVDLTTVPRVIGVPRFIIGGAARHLAGWLAAWLGPNGRQRRATHWLALAYSLGYVREAVKTSPPLPGSGVTSRRTPQVPAGDPTA